MLGIALFDCKRNTRMSHCKISSSNVLETFKENLQLMLGRDGEKFHNLIVFCLQSILHYLNFWTDKIFHKNFRRFFILWNLLHYCFGEFLLH